MASLYPFVHEGLASRVVFGWDSLSRLNDEVERLKAKRVLVLSTEPQRADAERVAAIIGSRCAGIFSGAAMHTPVSVTQIALAVATEIKADATVAIGGGSTTGLGKAIAVRTGLPQIVIPTTYAGSEMTSILGETEDGVKKTRRSPDIQPEVVIYDPALTLTLPTALSTTSGINAIAHAVEALYARNRTPIIEMVSEEGIRAFAQALPAIIADPKNQEARTKALYGAWLCGMALGSVEMSLHHKLCHVLGGAFDLPHAETHTVILPYAVAFNADAAPQAMRAIERALGHRPAAEALSRLAASLDAPTTLKDLGMPRDGIKRAADLAMANSYWNPRSFDRTDIQSLIENAFEGHPPGQLAAGAE